MKKKPIVFTLIVIVALALACAAVFLYERSKVALIIDDEAAWDLRDASPHKKVIITNDGIVARYACDGKGNDLVAGYRDGWFAIEMNGNIGYIREEYVSWDARWLAAKAAGMRIFNDDEGVMNRSVVDVIDSRIKE